MTVKNQVQLITYPDSLGGDLPALHDVLQQYGLHLFKGGVHILPPFPSSADRGFAPLTYFEIEPQFGSWEDIKKIGHQFDVLVDLMVNHISRQSPYFQDFVQHGRQSQYADLFITLDKIWPTGQPPPEDVAKIFLRKPEHPFSDITIQDTGEVERVWTSFGSRDWSEQIDFDVHSPLTRQLLTDILTHFRDQQVNIVRLDAVGYVIKKPGTSCFFVEPELYHFMEWIQGVADERGLALLPEVHAHYSIQFKLAEQGYWVYDFVLPALILHTLLKQSSGHLQDYLKICPRKQFTMLDCHDGIPVQPDMDDILSVEALQEMVDICLQRGANLNRILSGAKRRPDFEAHQINCTYYSALDHDDEAYLAARAIQFFAPGVPQVYYVGFLAGENDQALVNQTGEGRAINRHNYTRNEIDQAIQRPVVQRLIKLIEFRNEYPAFNGQFQVLDSEADQVQLSWQLGDKQCDLVVNLQNYQAVITYRAENGDLIDYHI